MGKRRLMLLEFNVMWLVQPETMRSVHVCDANVECYPVAAAWNFHGRHHEQRRSRGTKKHGVEEMEMCSPHNGDLSIRPTKSSVGRRH